MVLLEQESLGPELGASFGCNGQNPKSFDRPPERGRRGEMAQDPDPLGGNRTHARLLQPLLVGRLGVGLASTHRSLWASRLQLCRLRTT